MANRGSRPLPVPSVTVEGFWGAWQDAVCDQTAATLLDRCVEARMLEQIDTNLHSALDSGSFTVANAETTSNPRSSEGRSVRTISRIVETMTSPTASRATVSAWRWSAPPMRRCPTTTPRR